MRESRERWVKEGKGLVKMGRIRRRDKKERCEGECEGRETTGKGGVATHWKRMLIEID